MRMKLLKELDNAFCDADLSNYPRLLENIRLARASNKRFYFIGNGGSAAIASHMAADWMKNGRFNAMAFNDAAAITCLANDLGYERSFSVPVQRFGNSGDWLFAISSSGESQNIIEAVSMAHKLLMNVVTLSGFRPSNRLRTMGNYNCYVPSMKYSVVEITHLAILHSLLDEVVADGASS